jgi:hypothetical protein
MRATILATLLLTTTASFAADRDKDGFYETGEGIRYKKVAFINVKVYDITSYAKELPGSKSKDAMISLDADKKLAWRMLRTVDAEKIRNALREAYSKNGFGDKGKIESLLAPIQNELKEGEWVTIRYDAGAHKTTLSTQGRTATVDGADFMKATWSIWFGNIDQPSLSDKLIDNLK